MPKPKDAIAPICDQCDELMVSRGSASESGNWRWKCTPCGTSTTGTEEVNLGYDQTIAKARAKEIRALLRKGKKKFVITSAQDTTAPSPFFEALKKYCKYNKAELIVVPVHYKNISLYIANQKYQKDWHEDFKPYLVDETLRLGPVTLYAGIKIQATAVNPLQGKQSMGSGAQWAIYGHPQFEMQSIATPGDMLPKRLYTTGASTVKNYSRTALGAKADFHHITGAIVVELPTKNRAFIRQLSYDGEGFYDLDKYYTTSKVTRGHRIAALTPGDGHHKFMLPVVKDALYTGKDSMNKVLRPEYIFHNDLLDMYFGSHHHEKDDVLQFKKYHKRDNIAETELQSVIDFCNEVHTKSQICVFVPSNHTDHFYYWLSRVDPKKDPANALLIHQLKATQYQNSLIGESVDPFEIYATPKLKCNFKFLNRAIPFLLNGIDQQHGDIGPNGSRGSLSGFARVAYKVTLGHSHTACVKQSAYQTGKCTGRLEYERGLSSHSTSHVVQYQNGKRTIVDCIGNEWRLR